MFANLDTMGATASNLPKVDTIKNFLSESATVMESKYEVNPINVNDFKLILTDNNVFNGYVETLVDGMSESDAFAVTKASKNI